MSFWEPIQGKSPSKTQLIGSHGIGLLAAALMLYELGTGWKAILLAFLAFDWVGGIVANAAAPVRDWWTAHPKLRRAFIPYHLVELPIVYWLTGGGILFALMVLVLGVKLFVFALGGPRFETATSTDPVQ